MGAAFAAHGNPVEPVGQRGDALASGVRLSRATA
jgi:hypothetical protein